MELHLHYAQTQEYPLAWHENSDVPVNWYVKKMKLTPDRDALLHNEWLTLAGIPPQCFQYRLGNRSALEWVIDQYQVSTDKRSGITSDPNRLDGQQYIARLVGKVVTVSVETVKLVEELARDVRQEVGCTIHSTLLDELVWSTATGVPFCMKTEVTVACTIKMFWP